MRLFARVSEGQVGIIERSGKYLKTIFPGKIYFLVPAIDELFVYTLKAKTHDFPKFSILLKDSFTVDVNVLLRYKIMEPWKARYEVENNDLEYSIERLLIKVVSNFLQELSLEEAVAATDELTERIKKQLNNAARNWGFKLIFVEIQSIKKSFLAEQEKDRLYDVHKGEKGAFMSEKMDKKDSSKVIHGEEESSQAVNFTELTDMIEGHNVKSLKEELSTKIEEIEYELEESADGEYKDIQLQQLEIFKEHQREMVKLHEKDIQQQQEDLMREISMMAKKQEVLFKKQKDLLNRQNELDNKKKNL